MMNILDMINRDTLVLCITAFGVIVSFLTVRYIMKGEEPEDRNCLYCKHINGSKCKKTGHVIDSGIAGEAHSKDCDDYKYEKR